MIVFLDLDGPILNTADRNFAVFCHVAAELGRETTCSATKFWELKRQGLSSADIFSQCGSTSSDDNRRFTQQLLKQIEMPSWLKLDQIQPGVDDWLSTMASQFVLVLITLRQDSQQLGRQLERLGLHRFFRSVLRANPTVGKGWELKRKLIVDSCYAAGGLIIGDTEIDIRAGKLMGLGTIAVSCGIRDAAFLSNEQPDLLVSFLTDITIQQIQRYSRESAVVTSK
jgi:phosphoglycolate phosphatase